MPIKSPQKVGSPTQKYRMASQAFNIPFQIRHNKRGIAVSWRWRAVPAGDYSFGSDPVVVRGAVDLRVHGQGPAATGGTSLWFDPGAGVDASIWGGPWEPRLSPY